MNGYIVSVVVWPLSHVQLVFHPMDCSPPGSSVHDTPQLRKLEWVAISFGRGSSQPSNRTYVSCLAGGFFTIESPGKPKWIYTFSFKNIFRDL